MRYCAVYGCSSSSSKRDKTRTFHRFPSDKLRSEKWVKACSRKDLQHKSVEELNRSHVVCNLHFEESCRMNNKLTCDAVPTLMLDLIEGSVITESTQTINLDVHEKEIIQTCDVVSLNDIHQNTKTLLSKATQTTAELSSKTPRYKKLLLQYKAEVKQRKILEKELDNIITSAKTPQLQSITNIQKKLLPHNPGNRFTKEFKLLASSLFFAKPKAYRELGKMICLPSERTLRRININTGTKTSPSVKNDVKL